MKTATIAAAAAALLANQASAYFILQGPTLAIDRQDAIISPGANVVASHVHNLVGASSINSNSNYDSLMNSKCTSLPVTVDKSAYWQPNLYYYDPLAQSYQSIPSYSKIYYLQRPGPKNETIVAFPPGFRMVAGNPNRKTYDSSSFADQAISYVCQDYSGSHSSDPEWFDRGNFFNHNCPQGMRAEVVFPSCWNGQDLYKSDGSHVAYPVQAVNTGDCPSTHPVHLVTLFQEFVYDVAQFPYNGNGTVTWVLANGDTTGYGLHADFYNGWPTDVLQAALDQCTGQIGGVLENCPPLAPYIDVNAGNACKIEGNLVDEDVGVGHAISQLPGCNVPWSSGPKPGCGATPQIPGYKSSKSVPAAGYNYYGCMAEPSGGRLFTGSTTSTSNMTSAVCTAFCSQGGFEWASVEYGDECRCGSTLSNGGTNATIPESQCDMSCPGNSNEDCGGPSTMSVYRNTNLAIGTAPALPTGWNSLGCVADNVNSARTLGSYSYSSTSMTIASCVNTCIGKGYTYAGIEYSSECYCSSAPRTLQTSSNCNMACSGDARYTCGGPNALTMFSASASISSSSVASSSSSSSVSSAASIASTSTGASTSSAATGSSAISASTGATSSSAASTASVTSVARAAAVSTSASSSKVTSSSVASSSTLSSSATSSSSAAASSTATPALNGYQYVGCVAEGSTGKLLTGASLVANDMTIQKCAAFCGQSNFLYSGLEYASECYCGSNFNNGGTGALVAASKCSMACKGDKTQKCGAGNILSLYKNPNNTPPPIVLPSGWSALGCLSDNVNKTRTLKSYSFSSSAMTYSVCINKCQGLGYRYAGVEYSSECYCSNALSNNVTSVSCSMPCSGSPATANCGGPDALTAFQFNGVSTSKRAIKVRPAPAIERRNTVRRQFSLL